MYVLYRLRDHRQFIVFGTVVFVLLVVSAFIQKVTVLQVSLSFAGYLYAVAKYYYIIHKPTKRSKCRIKYLENKLNILGPAEPLTNYQIETLYPFMSERRIKDLRQLAIGKSAKDLQYENGITYSAQTKEHNTMREKLGRVTDQDITSVAQLVRVGIEVGIIQVNYVKHTH